MNVYARATAAALIGSSLFCVSFAWAQHSASDHTMVKPSELKWTDVPSLPSGAKLTVIQAPINQAVPFTARLSFPSNYKLPPHRHPAIEHVTVLSGTFNMGAGKSFDQAKTMALTLGSVAIMQVKTPHFAWTKEEPVVQIHGVGHWGIEYVNATDHPRAK